jgi:hypothetical protein
VHGATPDRGGAHDTDTIEHHIAANNAATLISSTVGDAPNVATDTTSQTPPGATATAIQDEHSTLAHNDTLALRTTHGPDDAYHAHNTHNIANGHWHTKADFDVKTPPYTHFHGTASTHSNARSGSSLAYIAATLER